MATKTDAVAKPTADATPAPSSPTASKAANGAKQSPPPSPAAQDKKKEKESAVKKDEEATKDSEEDSTDDASVASIDMETFKQILDLDEDDTYEFSREMAWAYFSQVGTTFEEMDDALAKKDLDKLSSLGHFLKGSSAALGVSKVQLSCTKIQHYGVLRDEEAGKDLTDKEALDMITRLLAQVKQEYQAAETWLRNWYKERGVEGDPE